MPVLLLTIFLDLVGYGILIPLGPLLFTDPSSPSYILGSASPQTGYIIFGTLLAIYPLTQFIATPILGQLSDRFGRKPILNITLLGTAISYVTFAVAILTHNIPLLFISRGIDGITGSNIAISQAALADTSDPKNRSRAFGLMGAAIGAGVTLGPFIGGIFAGPLLIPGLGYSTAFWFAALLSFLNVILIQFFFKETYKPIKSTDKINLTKSVGNIVRAFNLEKMRPLFTTSLLYSIGFSFYAVSIAIYLNHRYGFTSPNIGSFYLYLGSWVIISQLLIVRIFAKRFSENHILRSSLFILSLCPLLIIGSAHWWILLFITPFFVASNSLTTTNIAALVSRSAGPTIQGEVLGINASVQALGQSIPPIIGGIVAAAFVYWSPLLISSCVLLVAAIVFFISQKGPKQAL